MTTLLHISDTHFGTEMPLVMAALERLAREQAPSLVVLSGDITQRATVPQFCAARAFADRLAAPTWLCIPGNHDIPLFDLAERVARPYRRYIDAFGRDLEPVFESDDCLVQGVNTTRWYRHKNGEVSNRQVERVAARLSRALPSQLRVVVVHQPVRVSRPEDMTNRVRGAEVALARWGETGADLILGGHIHLPYALPQAGASISTEPALWAVQAGTALSSRVRAGAPNSVNLLRYQFDSIGARVCELERWDFVFGEGCFRATEKRSLPLRTYRPQGTPHAVTAVPQ